jgi:hypothetical protein
MAEESQALAEAGAAMAAEGLADLAAARAAREVSTELAGEGIAQVADGAADLGASEALHAAAVAVETRADASAGEPEDKPANG